MSNRKASHSPITKNIIAKLDKLMIGKNIPVMALEGEQVPFVNSCINEDYHRYVVVGAQ